ncbi:MAG: flagellar hook-basal body complex protein [Clostridiaceae bacterium]|nr:flagellar hook-basal body complex protein [Clostridiaceae bacterium]
MLKSLYSGISGMRANQQKLDVVGNNIANVGTTAFKGSRARFQDMLSQSVSGAQGSTSNQGGINASQIGLGVKIGGIDVNQTQGSMTPTSSVTDLAIDGDGYFIVAKGQDVYEDGKIIIDSTQGNHSIDTNSLSSSGEQVFYTRDGSFSRDSLGNFVNSGGYRVMGYSITGESNGVTATGAAPAAAVGTSMTFKPSAGEGLNGYTIKVQQDTATPATTNVKITTAYVPENPAAIPPVVQTNGVITVNLGGLGTATSKDVENALNSFLGSNGFTQTIAVTQTATPLVSEDTTASTANGFVGGTPVQSIDGNNRINFVDATGVLKAEDTSLKALKIPDKVYDSSTGTYLKVTKVSIDAKGILTATLEDQRQTALGQVALASFNNTAGLKDIGNNLNQSTVNSGVPVIMAGQGTTGQDNSKGYGDINSGFLEASNVDLTEQFTEMIVTTRAFEANGKTITNGDEILQTIIGLKR